MKFNYLRQNLSSLSHNLRFSALNFSKIRHSQTKISIITWQITHFAKKNRKKLELVV